MDLTAIRSRLAGSEGRLYWRSLGELADTPEFREYLHREFPEQASEWNDPKGRRDFLKLMSASLALAGVGACTKQPTEAIIPYVRQPEDIVPGRPLFFASAIVHRGYAQPGARREPHGAADENRGQPGSSGESRRRRQLHAGGPARPVRPGSRQDRHLSRRSSVVEQLPDGGPGSAHVSEVAAGRGAPLFDAARSHLRRWRS